MVDLNKLDKVLLSQNEQKIMQKQPKVEIVVTSESHKNKKENKKHLEMENEGKNEENA